ncbi:MAG: pyrophosphatase [Proteobacteria bacterium]|nr:pyrophosphatase [Pseudomonadota bacterium]
MTVDLAELQEKIVAASHRYAAHYGIARTEDWVVLKLSEEAGEAVQSYLKLSGRSRHGAVDLEAGRYDLAGEVADLIGMALILAAEQKLDLVPAFERKWRISLDPASSKDET